MAEDNNGISKRTLDLDRDSPTQETESELRSVTTVSPMNLPNHRPVLKGLLLHEHLLTRDFQGDQHFFKRDDSDSVAAYSTMPGSVSASDGGYPVTQVVPHEDAPAFSDIASTATAAATSPPTTFSRTTSRPVCQGMCVPQKMSFKTKGMDKVEPTTGSLTTQVSLNSRGSLSENPGASASSQRSHSQIVNAPPVEVTLAPSSMQAEEGEARQTALKGNTGPDNPLLNIASREDGANTTSTTVITTITTMQTAGRHVEVSFDFQG